ncbi:response regulator [Dasania marina]|uniref:response regulator n=1 Tax=Dasania marina TaxID=471499 RepID=UPI000380DFA1|nr:response regulator [Dasania marina]
MDSQELKRLREQVAKLSVEKTALQQRLSELPNNEEQELAAWLDSCSSAIHIEQLDLLLGNVVNYLHADGATLSIYQHDAQYVAMTVCYPVVNSHEKLLCDYSIDEYPWSWQQLLTGQTLILNALDDIPKQYTQDLSFYQKLNQPSSIQVPLMFEERVQGLLELHSQGRSHHWRDIDIRMLERLSQPFFSACNRIIKDNIDREGLVLLQQLIHNTGVSYALLNHQRSLYTFGSNMASMFNLPANTPLNPQLFDQQWWQTIFEQGNLTPLVMEWIAADGSRKFFSCTPTIIHHNTEQKPDTVLIGYTDITQLQTKTIDSQWLINILQKLHISPDMETIQHILGELLKHVNASGVIISLDNAIITTESADDAMVKNVYQQHDAKKVTQLHDDIYQILKTKKTLFFSSLDSAPQQLLNNKEHMSILQSIAIKGLYSIKFKRPNGESAIIILDWDKQHEIPKLELIETTLLSVGDTIFAVIDQISDKKILQTKISQEQWLTTQIDKLYRSNYPIESAVNQVLKALCRYVNAERIFIRHRKENSGIYKLSYQYCEPGIASIKDTVGAEIDLSNLPPEHILMLGKPQAINNMEGKIKSLAAKKNLVLHEDPIQATLMMPLFGIEGIPAYIAVDCLTRSHEWTKEHEQVVQAIGDAICMTHDRQDIYYRLLNSEQRFSMAMEASQNGIWEWQLDSDEIYVSPGCSKLFGFTHQETHIQFNQDRILKRIHDDDKAMFLSELDKLLQHNLPFENTKIRFITKENTIIWCYSRKKFTSWNSQGKPTRLIGVIINISDFIKQQQALDKARIEAEQANNEKNDFLARMSHEIRTPMNAIIGLSHLVKDTPLNEKQHDFITHIHSAANSLLGIINDILDYSKIAAGKLILNNTNFDFEDCLNQVIRINSFLTDQKSLQLLLDHDSHIPKKLFGDNLRLSQILTNLLSNAVKFTEQGDIIVKTQLLALEKQHAKIQINVIDSGMGISDNYIQQLFDPFSQADGTISRRFGGTGLGLTIVQHLASLMGGNIGVVSELNKGTNFTLTLSFALAKKHTNDQQRLRSERYDKQLQGLHILVAEDNIVNQKVAAGILRKKGINCQFANNGQEAINLLQERGNHYDAILMDIEMPDVDGYQASTYIRQTLHNNIPIIAMTAHAMSGDADKAMAAGMNAHVTKPINPDTLYEALSQQLSPR